MANLMTDVWTGYMIKAFRQAPEGLGWYTKIRSFDQYVDNDNIHFVDVGGDPTVLVNNTSYPLGIETLEDADKSVSLDKYQTKPTRITDDELYALSYDKKASVIERHRDAIAAKKYSRALHSISPDRNTGKTPVIRMEADTFEGFKKALLALKLNFDRQHVPAEGRILVLCPEHISLLLSGSQNFAGQYYSYTDGKVMNLFGFTIYEYGATPSYTASLEKEAYGVVPAAGSKPASVAFWAGRMMRADGSVKTYLSEAKDSPATQENLVSFRTYSICLPLKKEAMGAIVGAADPADGPKAKPTITGDNAIQVGSGAGENRRTYATSDGSGLTAESDAQWLAVAVEGNKVVFTREAYPYSEGVNAESREAHVTVGIAGTDVSMEVTVTQPMAAQV